MYLGDDGSVFIETHHPAYAHVADFLVSCCEPVSRTHHMQHYRLDAASLSAASAEGTYTCDMIRNVLRYFRLDRERALPIDLQRYLALARWAASSDADVDAHSYRALPFVAEAMCKSNSSSSDAPRKRVKLEATDETTTAPPSRRVLSLRRRTDDDDNNKKSDNVEDASCAQPLVAYAVVRPLALRALPSGVEAMLREEENASRMLIILQPRMRRFHDTTTTAAAAMSGIHDASEPQQQQQSNHADSELHYFLVSRDRRQLEAVMDGIREFVQPVLLHGAPRYVVSDVDRDAAAAFAQQQQQQRSHYYSATAQSHEQRTSAPQQQHADDGAADDDDSGGGVAGSSGSASGDAVARGTRRPLVLRRLFATPSHAHNSNDDKDNNIRSVVSVRSGLVYKVLIQRGKLRNVKERLFRQYGIRADCHYEFAHDATLHVERLSLRSHTRLRHYQAASLERFCGDGRKAHHGVVVLPCGAGKTLTGIAAAATLRKRTLVLCINNMSVFQWRREFLHWTNLSPTEVTVCTAKVKQMPGSVFITTYNMLISKRGNEANDGAQKTTTTTSSSSTKGRSARATEAILAAVTRASWGLLLLDEVHTALARHFQEVLNTVQHKCVLGLSATLLREDDRIADLRHLVGPKLHEANWLELTRQGYLARVECAEVQCPLPRAYAAAYAAAVTASQQQQQQQQQQQTTTSSTSPRGGGGGVDALTHSLAACNPYKLWCTQALLEFHRHRSPPDKVILFCDYLADVQYYAHHLHLPFMDQRTSEQERANLLQYFQHSDEVNAIILTRVGDVALDLPCASVIIQISGLGASRRQEAQRLGRIMRPKPPSLDNTCAYFYTLVSQDTHEVRTSYERQSWLRDQGFGYRVLHGEAVLRLFAQMSSSGGGGGGASAARSNNNNNNGCCCCVGPPRWWFQVVPSDAIYPSSASTTQQAHTSRTTTTTTTAASPVRHRGRGVPVVAYKHAYWAAFSHAASARIQRSFDYGKDVCVLTPDVLGPDAVALQQQQQQQQQLLSSRSRSSNMHARAMRYEPTSWRVHFSSANAPDTFGVVHMTPTGDGGDDDDDSDGDDGDGDDATMRPRRGHAAAAAATPRRIRCGLLGQPHDCQHSYDEDTGGTCFDYALAQLRATARAATLSTTADNDDDDDGGDGGEGDATDMQAAVAAATSRGRKRANRRRNDDDDDGDGGGGVRQAGDDATQSLLAYALS